MRTMVCTLLPACLFLVLSCPGQAAEPTDARAILRKAIKASGRDPQPDLSRTAAWQGMGTIDFNGSTLNLNAEWFLQGADRYRINAEGDVFTFVMIINKDKGWMKIQPLMDEFREMDRKELSEKKQQVYLQWVATLTPLQDEAFKPVSLGESKIDGRPAEGMIVRHKGQPDVRLFFDRDNHRLLRSESRVMRSGREVTEEILCNDYKERKGVAYPGKLTTRLDGKAFLDIEITEFQPGVKLSEKLFAGP